MYLYAVKTNRLLLLALVVFLPLALRAQEDPDYALYRTRSGMGMPIFRSRVADVYGNNFNGTYLVDTLGFRKGSVCFEGKTYEGLLLNLDAAIHHVLMREEGSPVVLDLGRDRVDHFVRAGVTFVNLQGRGYNVPAGFYQEVAAGRGGVYRRIDKNLRHLFDLNHSAQGYIGYEDPHYRDGIIDYYEQREYWYWVKEDGTVQRLRSERKKRTAIQSVLTHETH